MSTLEPLQLALQQFSELFYTWRDTGVLAMDRHERLHREGVVLMHQHYRACIPSYHRLAEELGLLDCTDPDVIRTELSGTNQKFKSYGAEWLDADDYTAMTRWLEDNYSERLNMDMSRVTSTDDWISLLGQAGVTISYSSGTSGHFSFVPRDSTTVMVSSAYNQASIQKQLERGQIDLSEHDGYLFSFHGGSQGASAFAAALGQLLRTHTFLFDFPIQADVLRANIRGTTRPELQARLADFRRETVDKKEARFQFMAEQMRTRSAAGRKSLLFGTPYLLFEFCQFLARSGQSLRLHPGSWLVMGGGWKSFAGEKVPRERFVTLLEEQLGLLPQHINESYSMIECSSVSYRCDHGRFHLPPQIWPFVVDENLSPIPNHGRGRFGFSDPLALSYPGFFISGDQVHLTTEPCACGMAGYSIVGEITRAASQEEKGCGAVATAFRA